MRTGARIAQVLLLVCSGAAAMAPMTFSSEGVHANEARCATCCFEEFSTCIVGDTQNPHRYYKESGSCKASDVLPPP